MRNPCMTEKLSTPCVMIKEQKRLFLLLEVQPLRLAVSDPFRSQINNYSKLFLIEDVTLIEPLSRLSFFRITIHRYNRGSSEHFHPAISASIYTISPVSYTHLRAHETD